MQAEELIEFVKEEYNDLKGNHQCDNCSEKYTGELCGECHASYYTGTAILIRLSKKLGMKLD